MSQFFTLDRFVITNVWVSCFFQGLYEFDEDYPALFDYVESLANSRYNEWKTECRAWWFEFKVECEKEGKNAFAVIPREFLNRPDDWITIRDYWESEKGRVSSWFAFFYFVFRI